MYSTDGTAINGVKDQHMELPSATESAFLGARDTTESDDTSLVRCPICSSRKTWLYRTDVADLEYPPGVHPAQNRHQCRVVASHLL